MKVEGPGAPSGPEKVPPEKDAFQQVLQQTLRTRVGPPRVPGSTAPRGAVSRPGGPRGRALPPPACTALPSRA